MKLIAVLANSQQFHMMMALLKDYNYMVFAFL